MITGLLSEAKSSDWSTNQLEGQLLKPTPQYKQYEGELKICDETCQ
jgi:hypothetical protein